MEPAALKKMRIRGDLQTRAQRNFDRLHEKEWQPHQFFMPGDYEWPADKEGRTILALSCLAQALHKKPEHLDYIINALPKRLNAAGYVGAVLEDEFDEQVLSGHSWLLRGLFEHHQYTGRKRSLELAEGIVRNLFLPLLGHYQNYPLDPGVREGRGEAIGSRTRKIGDGWRLSTDVGCAFIPIDGLSQAYEIFQWPELAQLLDEAIARYAEADKVALNMQTHATLSGLRGILRYYEQTGQKKLLKLAVDTYDLYRAQGTTENFENYNWFGRPEWTEPCAVVDSFMAVVSLWRHTGKPEYIEDAHHIYYNGLGYEQRPNGGFGCNVCAGAKELFLQPQDGLFEAWWCCTMRGGEGLVRAVEFTWWRDGDAAVLPFFHNSLTTLSFDDGEVQLELTTKYPEKGVVRIKVKKAEPEAAKDLRLYVPGWVEARDAQVCIGGEKVKASTNKGFLHVEGALKKGAVIDYTFPTPLRLAPTINEHNQPGYNTLRHGPLILGTPLPVAKIDQELLDRMQSTGPARYRVSGTDIDFAPINEMVHLRKSQAIRDRRQILFLEKTEG